MADDKKYVVPREKRIEDINKAIDKAKVASDTVAESLHEVQRVYDKASEQKVLTSDDVSNIARRLKPVVDNLGDSSSISKALPKPSTADDNTNKP